MRSPSSASRHLATRRSPGTIAAATALALAVLLAAPAAVAAQEIPAEATPTRLVVRAVSHDAKVIGSGVGGARVTVRDAATGRVMAQGIQEGGTGDTGAIMGSRERGEDVYAHEGTAAFETVLGLTAPTTVLVEAEGPLGTPHAEQRASATLLMIPGVDVVGDGLVLVLHGFTVVLEEPAGPAATLGEGPIEVRAEVTMLCGCPIEPGGLWDADRITVTAALVRDGEVMAEAPLSYAGETSHFAGEIAPPEPGRYELRVTAVDAERANTGMVTREITVGPA